MSAIFTPEQIKRDGYLLYYMQAEDISSEHCFAAASSAKRKYGYNQNIIDFIPRDLLSKEMCMDVIRQNGEALRSVPDELKDREMCLAAVTQYGEALVSVPTKFRDKEMCLAAVAERGTALFYVPKGLIDKELALIAVRTTPYALNAVPEYLRDYDVCLRAMDHGKLELIYRLVPPDIIDQISGY